jgi:hypothetical protein
VNVIGDAYWPGTGKVFVGVKWTLEETEQLIECSEKNGEESVEGMRIPSGTDVAEQGKK